MALESATYISDLVSTNPTTSDPLAQGDDHIRLLKATVKATFPNVSGAVTADHTELNKLDGLSATTTELNYVDGVTSPIQTQIDLKAPLASPTFTGTVTLPSATSIGNVSATELGYLDGVTSALQTQIDLKAPIASPTFTGTPAAPTASAYTATTQLATTAQVYSTVTTVPINYQNTTAYTLQLSDVGKMVHLDAGTAITLTVPSGVFSSGHRIEVTQLAGGQVTIVAGSGVTMYSAGSLTTLKGQWSAATIHFWDTNRFHLIGDLA